MAKVKNISAGGGITIDLTSKDAVYQFTADAIFDIYVDDDDLYSNFAQKSGNNLIITTVYENALTGSLKNISTTFKNFFNSTYEVEVTYTNSGVKHMITKNSPAEYNYEHLYTSDDKNYYLAPTKKKLTTEITEGSQSVFNVSGNNTYVTSAIVSYIADLKGNDTYKSKEDALKIQIKDYSGKDTYLLDKITPSIADFKGDDKFSFKNVTSDYQDEFSIKDYSGSDKYEFEKVVFSSFQDNQIVDVKGNDKYTIKTSEYQLINDLNGNDKYFVTKKSDNIKIKDNSGKDTYNVNYNVKTFDDTVFVSNLQIVDLGLKNDKYNLQFTGNEYKESDTESRSIIDDGGNDIYNLASTGNIRISDLGGNDKYNLKAPVVNGKKYMFEGQNALSNCNATSEIYDEKGNDKYNISYSFGSKIYDSDGKDTYNIKGEVIKTKAAGINMEITVPSVMQTEIHDTSLESADTYNISSMGSLVLIGGEFRSIEDYGGNNKFNIKNAGKYVNLKEIKEAADNKETIKLMTLYSSIPSITISCIGKGNDTYNFSNSLAISFIKDSYGDDKYNLNKISGSVNITDETGNDKYTIKKNRSVVNIVDNSGDDSYVVDNLKLGVDTVEGSAVFINDKSGKDTLKISSLKKSNIVYMANFSNSKDESYMSENYFGLTIYDKKNGGFVDLVNFYEVTKTTVDEVEKGSITGFGSGIVETFKAGKTKIDLINNTACDYNKMESLRETVGAWLSSDGRNYDDVNDVLVKGSKEEIKDLIRIFQNVQS